MVTNKRTGLGRGIGSLIPTAPNAERPVDVFFPDQVATGAIPVPRKLRTLTSLRFLVPVSPTSPLSWLCPTPSSLVRSSILRISPS